MAFRVIYSREAQSHLIAIDRYIAREASPRIAHRFVDGLVARCDSLAEFPFRGSPRDDIRPGMRTMVFRRRATIIYSIENETVIIIGVLYAGRDITSLSLER